MVIESDCRRLIEEINSSSFVPSWDGVDIVLEIKRKAASSRGLSFVFVGRQSNRAAHWLASAQKSASLSAVWKSKLPLGLAAFLLANFSPSGIG